MTPNTRLVLLAALLPALVACTAEPDETRIRNTIEAMAQAVENKERGEFMDAVGDDFTGQNGSYDRARAEQLLRVHLLRNRSINVLVSGIEIEVQGDRATARFDALLTGSDHWIPERGQRYRFTTGWWRDGGDWQVINARWE